MNICLRFSDRYSDGAEAKGESRQQTEAVGSCVGSTNT